MKGCDTPLSHPFHTPPNTGVAGGVGGVSGGLGGVSGGVGGVSGAWEGRGRGLGVWEGCQGEMLFFQKIPQIANY